MTIILTRRQRLRQATRDEILKTARQQIAADGNSALSLHAVARQMGMTTPALYRYFKSRDDLLTALIEAAYNSLGLALRRAVAACAACDFTAQALALARAYRAWALAHAPDFALTISSPLPDYSAPAEAIVPAIQRSVDLIVEIAANALAAGQLKPAPIYVRPPSDLQAQLDAWKTSRGYGVPTQALHVAVIIWSRIRGLVSLELRGHIQPLIGDPEVLFEAELHELLERAGFSFDTAPNQAG